MLNSKPQTTTLDGQQKEVFVGPRPFERSEQNLFFGRDREVSELLSLVTSSRVVLCYAPSGAGKTSLINAGLQPRLEKEGFEVLPSTRVRGLIPDGVDEKSIANIYAFNAILSLAGDSGVPAELTRHTMAEFLSALPHRTDEEEFSEPRILIFDQFEELLTAYLERWQEREGFFQQVFDALQADPLLRVLFVMREDFVARIEPYMRTLKPLTQTRFRLDLLGPGGAQAAVTGPLRNTDRHFKDGVVDSLIEELRKVRVESAHGEATEVVGESVEPVQLQVVCRNLWTSLPVDVKEISHEHLEAYGDVDQALREFYEKCITDAKVNLRANESDLRYWFEHQLVTPAGTRSIVFRDARQTAGLSNAVVDFLENRHVIRGEWRAGSRWYELTHDRLIKPIQSANERWQTQRQKRRNRIFSAAGILAAILLMVWAGILSAQQTATAQSASMYTQSAYTSVAFQSAAESTASVAQATVVVAQEDVAISRSRQLGAEALLVGDPNLALLLGVEANNSKDTAEARRSLHKILSRQSVIDGTFLRAYNPGLVSPSLIEQLDNQGKWVVSVAFSPDGRRFVSGGQDGILTMWDVGTAQAIEPTLKGHKSNVEYVTYSPDGRLIASAALDAQVLLWDASTGERVGPPLLGHTGLVTSVAFSPDGRLLASGGQDGELFIWDVSDPKAPKLFTPPLSQPAEIWGLAWSPDGTNLAAASAGSWIRLYETKTYKEYRVLKGANGLIRSIAWSPDSKTLAGGAVVSDKNGNPTGGDTVLWDVNSLSISVRPFPQNIVPVRSVAFDPGGTTLAVGRDDGTIILWDVRNRQTLGNPIQAHAHRVMSIAFSPDGQYMVSGSIDKTIKLWNVLAPARSIAINPQMNLLATSQGSYISLWDMANGTTEPVELFTKHTGDVLALAFSPDGSTLVSSGKDNKIRLWDIKLGQQIVEQTTKSNIPTLQFNLDGTKLALAGESGRVQLADPYTISFTTIMEENGPVLKVQYTTDGKILNVVGRNGNLSTFDMTSTEPKEVEETTLPSSQGGLTSVALSLDGTKLAYFQEGGTGETAILTNDGRAHGIELSSWDQSFDPNVNRDDIDFIMVKATEGTSYTDPILDRYLKQIQMVPMRGAYHFFRDNQPWKEQADFFLSAVKDKGFQFYVLYLDVRPTDGTTQFLADAEQWVKYVDSQVEGKVLVEAGGSYLQSFDAATNWVKSWPLFVDQYPNTPDRNGSPLLPTGFNEWKFWNYSEKGNGAEYGTAGGGVYLLVYNGTPLEMGEWLGINAFTILDRRSGEVLHPQQVVDPNSANSLAFNSDASYLAIAGIGSVSLLDGTSGEEISKLYVGGHSVLSLSFLPDNSALVIGMDDGTVFVWDLKLLDVSNPSASYMEVACSQIIRNMTEAEWSQYFGGNVERKATCSNLPMP